MPRQHCSIFVNIAQVKSLANIEKNETIVQDKSARIKEFKVGPRSDMPSIRYY